MPQFAASITDDLRVIIYDCNVFIGQPTDWKSNTRLQTLQCYYSWGCWATKIKSA